MDIRFRSRDGGVARRLLLAPMVLGLSVLTAAVAIAATGFSDVESDHPHEDGISWAADVGVTVGCGDGTTYCPSDFVTRGQMASFLQRTATSGVVDAGTLDGRTAEELAGSRGPAGATGAQGPAGPAGVSEAAQFYALMPPDNAATVAPGTDVDFPQDGPNTGDAITRAAADQFNLAEIGVYRVSFQVPVDEAGQLILTLNGADLTYTVAGRATGTSQITGTVLVETTAVNAVLTLRNPAGNATALTVTPLAGGTRPVSAQLLIERVA